MSDKIKLQKIKIKDTLYAKDKNSNKLYDFDLVKLGILEKVGTIKYNSGEKILNRVGNYTFTLDKKPNKFKSIKQYIKKKLDKINLNKHSIFIEKEYRPGGPGYIRSKNNFEKNIKNKSKSRKNKSLSLKHKSKKKSTRKIKTI